MTLARHIQHFWGLQHAFILNVQQVLSLLKLQHIVDPAAFPPEATKLFMPSELDDNAQRDYMCVNGAKQAEECIQEVETHDCLQWMRQGLCNQGVSHLFTIKNITGQNPTTRNQSILHTIQINIHTNKLWYHYMRNALFWLHGHGSWEEKLKVLKDEDVWGLSKHMLMDDELHMQEVLRMHGMPDFVVPDMSSWAPARLGDSQRVLSWIWH